ncbi:MAG: peptidylprolyl isomerase [Pseudomonadota bacterium]
MPKIIGGLPRALVAIGLALALPTGPARAADDPNEVVGKVGSAEIKLGQVRDFLRHLEPAARQQAEKDPQVLLPILRNDLGRLAVLNEARDKKWDQRPEVQAAIEQQRTQVIVASYLQSVVQLPPGYPSDAEVQAAYESNKGNLTKPGQFHLAQIFLALPASADKGVTDAVLRRAEELARKVRGKGGDFAAVARESSDHKESAVNGGDIGWLNAQQLLPEIRNVVAGMARGDSSQPIRSPAGFHIVKLIESKPSELAPLADVRDELIRTMRQRKTEELQAAYVNAMVERGGTINEMALRRAVVPGQ